MSENKPFVHLRVHSAYSLLEGALKIPKLVELAKADAAPALALTDSNNLFGALEFSEAVSGAGIQPIVGCTLNLTFEKAGKKGAAPEPLNQTPDGRIALLAKDEAGYGNLMELTSRAYFTAAETGEAFVTIDELAEHSQGLIALSGGPEGLIDTAFADGNAELARARVEALHSIFGDRFYIELQRHGLAKERAVEPHLVQLAYERSIPLVATNEPFFATTDDFEAHDALICIAQGSYVAVDERRRLSPEHYFKSAAEMRALFADLPEAIENTAEIAQRCAYRPQKRSPILPAFLSGGEASAALAETEAEELKRQAEEGLTARIAQHGTAPGSDEAAYRERLAFELEIITRMNYQGYFLIVSDFIKWTKGQGIPVGPGRGSGAGSLVAYALTITDLDPIRFGLLFERFLNPERVSMPDFDIDFCQDRRDEVIAYVRDRYGADRVAQIITFGKLQARAVLRDVGRVLQMPYGQVDRLCKLVPMNPANPVTLPQAIAGEPRLQEERDKEPIVAKLLDIGQRLEGLYRHASTHAAGVVIADRPLTELVPLYRDARAQLPATQFNMKWAEAAGLVKFDFLGLKTLTVLDMARKLIARDGPDIDPSKIPLDDTKTYEMIQRAETVGVFQLESQGMRDALRKLKPDRFEDIIAMVALYRPGPMDNIETFVNRKHGKEKIESLHPMIEPILAETYGVIIYQEQVMQIAQVLSGYSLGEADLLRRAMGKKIKAEMDKQRKRFVDGAVANGVEKGRAEYIFELVAKFAGYGFNKSHAAAYALIAYQTAYLKANYPPEFVAASMTLDMGNADKLNSFAQEARRLGIKLEQPSVNYSEVGFIPNGKAIRYSLAALKNVGQPAVESIVAERNANGLFADISDFARRLNPRHVNKRALETLATAGPSTSSASTGPRRSRTWTGWSSPGTARKKLAPAARTTCSSPGGNQAPPPIELRKAEPWLPTDRLAKEFEAVGFFLTGHPLDEYSEVLKSLGVETWTEFAAKAQTKRVVGRLAGTVLSSRERKGKTGNPYAFVAFSDATGQFEAVIFSEALIAGRDLLEAGSVVLLDVEAEADGETVRVRVQGLSSLDNTAEERSSGMKVTMDDPQALSLLAAQIDAEGGQGRFLLRLLIDGKEVEFDLPQGIDSTPRQRSALKLLDGVLDVSAI
ncbi:DNA polymerase III subunit alpha [Methyloceanibacter stevinii]|uniref:DNA polymerase III subunit alpha n=1 Tax=Methyloceanibacter stevinii TaxID=1774970 RepID=A0A1E3VLG4_9HYPH|nr:DNA polymerase III subunit alpha [Methyloceanibacter stevinii]ODR94352.1 DNA polymerase III subunit alpha [Methyloceanibacter stevinii]